MGATPRQGGVALVAHVPAESYVGGPELTSDGSLAIVADLCNNQPSEVRQRILCESF